MKITYGIVYLDHTARFSGTINVRDGLGTPHIADILFGMFNAGSGTECEAFKNARCRSMSVGDLVLIYVNGKKEFLKCEEFGWDGCTETEFKKHWYESIFQ